MGMLPLLIVSLLVSASVIYLIFYIPLKKSLFGRSWSPRIFFCRYLLIPLDITCTLTLLMTPMITGISGILAFVAAAFTAAGLSLGVFIAKRWFQPHWEEQYKGQIASNKQIFSAQYKML